MDIRSFKDYFFSCEDTIGKKHLNITEKQLFTGIHFMRYFSWMNDVRPHSARVAPVVAIYGTMEFNAP